jgi:RNA 3'-terminal phosphate cyclase (ATP)
MTIESHGQTLRREARAMCTGLAGEIGVRELAQVKKRLDWSEDELVMRQLPEDQGPGNVVMISIVSENVTEIATGFGQRGVLAETVADGAIDEIRAYIATDAPIGVHLADQLLIPLALAGAGRS